MMAESHSIWDIEDILEENQPRPGKDGRTPKSKLKRHIEMGGVLPEALTLAANELERREPDHVAAFFQLPFPVILDEEWATFRVHLDVGFAQLHVQRVTMEFDKFGRPRVVPIFENGAPQKGAFTQCILLAPVFGVRAMFHHKFVLHAENGVRDNPVIVPQGPSWINNADIRFLQYEDNFAGKLLRVLNEFVPKFIPAYSISTLSDAFIPHRIMGYCAMIAPGRVSFSGDFAPIVEGLIDQIPGTSDEISNSAVSVSKALEFGQRNFGDFENQIFALERMRRSGEPALALNGACSLLEWLLQQHLAARLQKTKGGFFKMLNQVDTDFMSDEEKSFVNKLRSLRNDFTHEKLPARLSIDRNRGFSGKEISGMSGNVSSIDVRNFLKIVLASYRRHNLIMSKKA